jgi:hypothetical protein
MREVNSYAIPNSAYRPADCLVWISTEGAAWTGSE